MTGARSSRSQQSGRDIEALVRERLVGESGHELFVRGPVYSLENSDIYYAECARFEYPLAIKRCRDVRTGAPDPATAKTQFRALEAVGTKMAFPDYGVPRTVELIEEDGILVTEWVAGDNLTRVLYRQRTSGRTVLELVRRAGTWLHLFHASNTLQPGRLDVEEKIATIHELQKQRGQGNPTMAEAVSLLEESADRAGGATLPRSWVHGDYKTDNLLIVGRRMVGLDVHVIHESVVHYDVAAFLNRLHLTLQHPKAWRLLRHRSALERGFIEESLQADAPRSGLPLAWIRLYMMLCSWMSRQRRETNWVRHSYLELAFRRLTRRSIRNLARLRSS